MHIDKTPISEDFLLTTIKLFLSTFRRLISNRIDRLEDRMDKIMAKVNEVVEAQAEETREREAAQARTDADFAEIRRLLDEAPKGTITEEELIPILDRIKANIAIYKAIDPDPAFPVVDPPPVPMR